MSKISDRWDKKSKRTKELVLREFGRYNIESSCPHCNFKKKMAEAFDWKVVKNMIGELDHNPRQCFKDAFMLHQALYPRTEGNKSMQQLRELAEKRFDMCVDLIKDSKK